MTGIGLEPVSADPSNPVQGQIQYSDGSARAEGLWVYDGSSWNQIPEGSLGSKNLRTETTTYTALTTDDVILANASGGAFTITLPAASGNSGKLYRIKKIDSSTNGVTIDGNSSETIDGSTTVVLYNQNDVIEIVCDGSNWVITENGQQNVFEQKFLTSDISSSSTATDLTFSNLVVGRVYRVDLQANINASGGNTGYIDITHNSAIIGKVRQDAGSTSVAAGTSVTFTAAATTLTFDVGSNGSTILGNSAGDETFAILTELNNTNVTTRF